MSGLVGECACGNRTYTLTKDITDCIWTSDGLVFDPVGDCFVAWDLQLECLSSAWRLVIDLASMGEDGDIVVRIIARRVNLTGCPPTSGNWQIISFRYDPGSPECPGSSPVVSVSLP